MSPDDFVAIERDFDASTEVLWSMWTEPTHFEQWYGPPGFTISVVEYDVRVGGRRLLSMTTPDGARTMWFVGEFVAVDPRVRLVYTDSNSDPEGAPLPPSAMGVPDLDPVFTEVTVELVELDGGRCRMHMTHRGIPAGSPGAAGWEMAFDKLAARLSPS